MEEFRVSSVSHTVASEGSNPRPSLGAHVSLRGSTERGDISYRRFCMRQYSNGVLSKNWLRICISYCVVATWLRDRPGVT